MKTNRGFEYLEFEDSYGEKCSIQESSSAEEPKIWLGLDDVRVSRWKKVVGWDGERIPARMHLNREQAKILISILEYFVEHGVLP